MVNDGRNRLAIKGKMSSVAKWKLVNIENVRFLTRVTRNLPRYSNVRSERFRFFLKKNKNKKKLGKTRYRLVKEEKIWKIQEQETSPSNRGRALDIDPPGPRWAKEKKCFNERKKNENK